MDTWTTLGKLPTPATHHLLTPDVQPKGLTELTMNFNRPNAFYAFKNFITELYHRTLSQAVEKGTRVSISDLCYHATGTRQGLSSWHMTDTS
ncbi:hypothetical protein TNCV_614161 [Trichonephila clavipes]|nr:hypothetical protein TNCV_614161 [Trichonephila clavipes]